MMMETAVYTREFLFAQELRDQGALGRIQFLRGAHYQDMEGWPGYWVGLPPMWYATHAVSPLLALAGTRACGALLWLRPDAARSCADSTATPSRSRRPSSSWRSRTSRPRSRAPCSTGRGVQESFDVYGENACFEWQQTGPRSRCCSSEPVVPEKNRSQHQPARTCRLAATGCPRGSATRPGVNATSEHTHISFHAGRRPRRLAPAPGSRVRPQHRGRPPTGDRRRDGGELVRSRYLRARVGPARRRGGNRAVLRRRLSFPLRGSSVLLPWAGLRLTSAPRRVILPSASLHPSAEVRKMGRRVWLAVAVLLAVVCGIVGRPCMAQTAPFVAFPQSADLFTVTRSDGAYLELGFVGWGRTGPTSASTATCTRTRARRRRQHGAGDAPRRRR